MGLSVVDLTGEKGSLDFEYQEGQVVHVLWNPDLYTPEREAQWMQMEAAGAGAMLVDFIFQIVEDWDLTGIYDEKTNTIKPSNTETYPVKNKKALAKLPVPFLGALSTAIGMASTPKAVRRPTSDDG